MDTGGSDETADNNLSDGQAQNDRDESNTGRDGGDTSHRLEIYWKEENSKIEAARDALIPMLAYIIVCTARYGYDCSQELEQSTNHQDLIA